MSRDAAHPEAQRAPAWAPPNPAGYLAKLHRISPIALQDKPVPPRRWIVPRWIPIGETTFLYGDGGLGKTLLAMMLASSCLTTRTWLGMEVMPCKAAIFHCEDDEDEMHRRQADINAALDIEFSDLDGLEWFPRDAGDDNALARFDHFNTKPPEPTDFFAQIGRTVTEIGAQLVILDSLHDYFSGNENDRLQARQFVRLLTGLARDIDGAVVMLAHPSRDGLSSGTGTSGSTAWSNACRSRLYLRRPKDIEADTDAEDVRVLRRMKSNYARSGDEITMRWRDGAFHLEQEATGAVKAIEEHRVERIFLDCLDAATGQGRALSDSANVGNYAPKIMATLPQAEGANKRQLADAMSRLFASGQIVIGPTSIVGSDRHKKRGIVRKAAG